MGRKSLWFSVLALVLAAAAGSVAIYRLRARPAKAPPPPAVRPAPPPSGVIALAGKIIARETIDVGAEVSGNVDVFLADVGQEVAEGQVLARLSNQSLETTRELANTALDNAQARVSKLEAALLSARMEASRADADSARTRSELDRFEKTFQRQRMLYREGATPRLAFEKANREYEAAQTENSGAQMLAKQAHEAVRGLQEQVESARRLLADKARQLEEAQEALAATEVVSPVDGVVVARRGEVGKPADEYGNQLFQISVNPSLLRIIVEPEPPVLQRIRPGMPAVVVVPELQTDSIPAVVKTIDRTLVVVDFTSPSPNIKPGMPGEVRLKIE